MGREWSRNQERDSETLPKGKPAVNGLGSFYRYQNHFFTLDCWYNSKYAKIGLEMKMQFASSNYQSPAHLQTITRYGDDNINVSGTIDNMIQPRTFTVPAPKGYEDKLFWIWGGIVAEGFVRGGGSHAMIDLSAHPFGIWCKGVEVIP